jgi:hypothetical protein
MREGGPQRDRRCGAFTVDNSAQQRRAAAMELQLHSVFRHMMQADSDANSMHLEIVCTT